jgi:hypothetical protein
MKVVTISVDGDERQGIEGLDRVLRGQGCLPDRLHRTPHLVDGRADAQVQPL